jgi:hypothetical protein
LLGYDDTFGEIHIRGTRLWGTYYGGSDNDAAYNDIDKTIIFLWLVGFSINRSTNFLIAL